MPDTIMLEGTYGILRVDTETGEVMSYTPAEGETAEYADITRVDVAEYRHTFGKLPEWADVVDIGLWTDKGKYIAPSAIYRHIHKERPRRAPLSGRTRND